ncbi:MAG TPA: hypothetical protein VN683_07805 [Acidothermaceae bacterium]|nr:hypothetical protein [Acidothermaceae bacterium]
MTQPPADHVHTVNNGKRDLTLDQLAATQPGLDRLMAELGPRMHRLYFAGKAGNWRLADYFFRSVVKQLSLCAFSRPKYEEAINTYITTDCEPVRSAIKAADGEAFEVAYNAMVGRANAYHDEFAKPWLHWTCPRTPPEDLDFAAGLS